MYDRRPVFWLRKAHDNCKITSMKILICDSALWLDYDESQRISGLFDIDF